MYSKVREYENRYKTETKNASTFATDVRVNHDDVNTTVEIDTWGVNVIIARAYIIIAENVSQLL